MSAPQAGAPTPGPYRVERDALGKHRVTNADQSLKLYNGYRNEAEAQFDADRLNEAYAAGLEAALNECSRLYNSHRHEYDYQRSERCRGIADCEAAIRALAGADQKGARG